MIYDGFTFFNELDLLELRLNELSDIVDKFIIVESHYTHTGKEKPLYYKENKERFAKFSDKIIHIVVDMEGEPDSSLDPWDRERNQRDSIAKGLVGCSDDDIVCVSDVDEIPRSEKLAEYSVKDGLVCLEQDLHYYSIDMRCEEKWNWFKILPYSMLKNMTPCQVRYTEAPKTVKNAGWHFSFLGDIDMIIKKIESFAHHEYDNDHFKNRERIKEAIKNKVDVFERGMKYSSVKIDYTYPQYILDNIDQFKNMSKQKDEEQKDHVTRIIEEVDGFFADGDIYAYREAVSNIKNGTIIEIGSYMGKSILSIADICRQNNNKIYCVDTWEGSAEHQSGEPFCLQPPEELFRIFNKNVEKFGFQDIITTVKMESIKAAEKFLSDGIKADLIFIDGDHSYESVKNDIEEWRKVLKKDGILCGHDVVWGDIQRALKDTGTNYYPAYGLWIGCKKEKEIEITATISTKDRYFDTLPLCIESVINQTYKPKKLIIFDDGKQKDLRKEPLYQNILKHLDQNGIGWQFVFGEKKGQVLNHQKAIELSETEWIWRIDDDEIAEPDVLEKLIKNIKDGVGAIGGLVLDPKEEIKNLPENISHNKIEEVTSAPNIQWYQHDGVKDVDHLYSSFIYRKEAATHGYCMELSPVGHREESIFTYEMKRGGWSILVDPNAVTWHYRSPQGGIRSYDDKKHWEHDEEIFRQKMEIWGKYLDKEKIIVLDSGMGDHIAFSNILPEILEKYPNAILSVCYPEVFSDFDVRLISIKEANMILGKKVEEQNIYQWMTNCNWDKHIIEAYREMYL